MSDGIKIRLETVEGNVIKKMLARAKSLDGFLNRVAYPMLIRMQRERWGSENDGAWKPLNAKYREYKLRKYASFPGAGANMMVATSQLYQAVTGDDLKYHRKLVGSNQLTISIVEESGSKKSRQSKKRSVKLAGFVEAEIPVFNYAKFANDERNFTEINDQTREAIEEQLKIYLTGG